MGYTWKNTVFLLVCLSLVAGCSTTAAKRKGEACAEATGCASETASPVSAPLRATEDVRAFQHGEFASTLMTPDVLAMLARRDAAGEEIAKARAMMLPSVSLDAQAGYLRDHGVGYPNSADGNAYSYGLSVEVPLYQGGRAMAAMKAAKADHMAASEAAKDTLLSTTYAVLLATAAAQRQKTAVAVLQGQERKLRGLRNSVGAEVDAGAASRTDLDDVNRQLARLAIEREQAKIGLATAEQTLMQYGITAPANGMLPSFASQLGRTEAELIETALRNNPRIAQRAFLMESASARVEGAKGAYKPTVSLSLGLNGEGRDIYNREEEHSARANVRLSFPLYTGGMRSADLRQKNSEQTAATLERDAAVNGVTAAVRSAIARRARAGGMIKLAQAEKRNAASALAGVKQERKLGDRSVYDEIRLNEDIANAEIRLADAKYELLASEYTLAAEIGLLNDFVGTTIPKTKRLDQLALN